MILFKTQKICDKLVKLALEYATDLTVEYKEKTFYLAWSEISYKLGAMKFCWLLANNLSDICEMTYTPNTMTFYNIKNKKEFLERINKLK